MRKTLYLLAFILLCSHNLYIKIDNYFLQPNQEAVLSLYNGSFEISENIITRDRMLDASFVVNDKREAIDPSRWKDIDSSITQLTFKASEEGIYVAGVSTKARNISLTAEKFNSYLVNDGVADMMKKRTNEGSLDQDAVESYQKHVKAIYQVGDKKTKDWKTSLGYPIEFIPQENPYEKYSGESLDVKLMLNNKPLPNQLVYTDIIKNSHSHSSGDQDHEHNEETHSHDDEHADHEHSHTSESKEKENHGHSHNLGQKLRTNDEGIVTIDLPEDGVYYLRTIYMTEVNDSDELTHQSKWATLTFGVTHKHGADTHKHEDEHAEAIPTWVFILGSLVIIGILFLIFRKNK